MLRLAWHSLPAWSCEVARPTRTAGLLFLVPCWRLPSHAREQTRMCRRMHAQHSALDNGRSLYTTLATHTNTRVLCPCVALAWRRQDAWALKLRTVLSRVYFIHMDDQQQTSPPAATTERLKDALALLSNVLSAVLIIFVLKLLMSGGRGFQVAKTSAMRRRRYSLMSG